MNEEGNNTPLVNPNPQSDNQGASIVPPSRSGGVRVLQPSETIKQELQAQQQLQPQATQPTAPASQSSQPNPTQNPASVYSEPTSGQMQVGMSASQLGIHEPKSKLFDFNPKQLIIKGVVALVVLGGVFTALVMTNIIALSEFKSMGYTDSKGTNYKLDFYTKHGSKQLKSGNKQIVSKISKEGKFPIVLSISTSDSMSAYTRVKDCGSFTKAFDVQSTNLSQRISVCSATNSSVGGQSTKDNVYIAGFTHNEKAYIITISQDYGDIDLSSPSGAQQSLSRFGMQPYKADIERIVSSIKVE